MNKHGEVKGGMCLKPFLNILADHCGHCCLFEESMGSGRSSRFEAICVNYASSLLFVK